MTLDPTTWQGHTPGPWVSVRADYRAPFGVGPLYTVGPSEFTTIADVRPGSDDDDLPAQTKATATLIAAAPELAADHARLLAENARLREALVTAIRVAGEAREQWDAAPVGMKAGKLLMALSNPSLRYREDITTMHAAAEPRA